MLTPPAFHAPQRIPRARCAPSVRPSVRRPSVCASPAFPGAPWGSAVCQMLSNQSCNSAKIPALHTAYQPLPAWHGTCVPGSAAPLLTWRHRAASVAGRERQQPRHCRGRHRCQGAVRSCICRRPRPHAEPLPCAAERRCPAYAPAVVPPPCFSSTAACAVLVCSTVRASCHAPAAAAAPLPHHTARAPHVGPLAYCRHFQHHSPPPTAEAVAAAIYNANGSAHRLHSFAAVARAWVRGRACIRCDLMPIPCGWDAATALHPTALQGSLALRRGILFHARRGGFSAPAAWQMLHAPCVCMRWDVRRINRMRAGCVQDAIG